MTFVRKHINLILVSIISLLGLYFRFKTLNNRVFWNDETYQFSCMKGEFKPFWSPPQQYGDFSSFPGEYVLNYFFVQAFGMNKWVLAIPHILIAVLGFWLLYKIGQYYFRSWVGYAVAFFIIAFNNNLIFHSFEFRPYGVLAVMALASLFIVHRFFDPNYTWGKIKIFSVGLLIVSIVNYHIYGIAIFLLPLIFVTMVHLTRNMQGQGDNILKHKAKRQSLYFFIPVSIVACIIWAWYMSFTHWGVAYHSDYETFQFISNPVEKPIAFLKGIFCNLVGNKFGYILLFSIIVTVFLPINKKKEQFLFLTSLVILPILLILDSDLKRHYWFLQRQFTWVMAFFSVLIGWQWDSMYELLRSKLKNNKQL